MAVFSERSNESSGSILSDKFITKWSIIIFFKQIPELNLILFIPYIFFSMFIVRQMYTFIHY